MVALGNTKDTGVFICILKLLGKGWLLYGPRNWYEGEWYQDKRQGMGLRQYTSGAVYKGMWHDNLQHGLGSMIYCNNDVSNS